MSIPMNATCAECFFNKRLKYVKTLGTDQQATEISKWMMLQYAQSPADIDSSLLGSIVDEGIKKYYGLNKDRYEEEKKLSNQFVLERMDTIRARVNAAEDPIFAGLQYAILGNYLDFSALQDKVSFADLDKMLEEAPKIQLDKTYYQEFCKDLAEKKKFLYITDNAGEIGFDRILGETIQAAYPHLEITYLVRGGVYANDATREDAAAVGIPFPILDNGSPIGGTVISHLSPEAKAALDAADVIIAKGMGNTESMYGCGYNVYYAFLVKCARFQQYFQKELMTPMFIRDPE